MATISNAPKLIDKKKDFQEKSDDESDERSSEEYLRDLDLEFHERTLLANSKQTFDWDEEEVLDEEEETRVRVLMALVDDDLSVGKNHARNGEWIDNTIKSEQISSQKKKILGSEQLIQKLSVFKVKENSIIHASLDYDHEMVLKSKDWVERLNPNSKHLNFNTERILVPESQTVNESLQYTKAPTDTESSKDLKSQPQTPLHLLKALQGASPSYEKPMIKFEVSHYTNHSTDDYYMILYYMKCKRDDHMTSDHDIFLTLLKSSREYKAQPYQYGSPAKQILKSKAKPFPPCIHCGFDDHRPDDYRNYPECKIGRSYNHFTSGHNRVILVKGWVLVESSQYSESSINVSCKTCGSNFFDLESPQDMVFILREKVCVA
uniref:Uncharacterized protein n=1 Tax=Tanacetum cinerariifolium TaxID=118510 RepID=A0A699H7W0_TANCI|nr:hypothetical protein [Tanacetum cinerariifolium]